MEDRQPRITQEHLEAQIEKESYIHEGMYCICLLELKCEYYVHGSSGCNDSYLYKKTVGEKYARKDAMNKLAMLEAYYMKKTDYLNRLREIETPPSPEMVDSIE